MRFIFLLFCIFIASSINGNNVLLTGNLTDYEKNILTGATIRCFVDDSIFVKGTTSNSIGDFKLELQETDKVIKLVLSFIGY